MKKILAFIAFFAMMFALMGAPSTAVAAGEGKKEKVGVCHRTGSETNPYVYIEVPADKANGHITGESKQHNHNVVWKSDGVWNGEAHAAGDEKLDYLASEQDVAERDCPNRTPDEEEPPVCADACKMPVVETDAPELTKCVGTIRGDVLNDVVVPRGKDCTLIDVYVNGDVTANDSRNVALKGTAVVGDINVDDNRNDFYFGPRGKGCSYDPMVGGTLSVTDSHNVLICFATVCEAVKVNNNDGKITIRTTVADRLVLKGNNTFRDTDNTNHVNPERIRLIDVDFNTEVISGNAPRKVVRR